MDARLQLNRYCMRKVLAAVACLVLLVSLLPVGAGADGLNGLVKQDGKIYYYENGTAVCGWKNVDGYRYYFDYNTRAADTGVTARWLEDGSDWSWFVFDAEGRMYGGGWVTSEKGRMYLRDDGYALKDWQTIDGETYYFDYWLDSAAVTGEKQLTGPDGVYAWFYFDQYGRLQTDAWISTANGKQYYDGNGKGLTGWQTIDGCRYHFDGTTRTADTGVKSLWLEDGSDWSWFCFDADGKMYHSGWYISEKGRMYLRDDGFALKNWQTIDGYTYYFDYWLDSAAKTGWASLQPEGSEEYKTFYFDKDGKMQTGWVTLEEDGTLPNGKQGKVKHKYYFGSDGVLQTGWQTIGGARYFLSNYAYTGLNAIWNDAGTDWGYYYFNSDGKMQTGLVTVPGEGVYFFSDNSGSADWGKAVDGWKKVGSAWYFFNEYSRKAETGLTWIDDDQYMFSDKGVMQTGWNDAGDKYGWRLFSDSGPMVTDMSGMSSVTVPAKVDSLKMDAFKGISRSFVIYCTAGSYAESFAIANGLQYDNGQKRVVGSDITNVDRKIQWILDNYTTPDMSDLEKIRALHDWVIHNAHYDTSYSDYSGPGILLNGEAVCAGYAEAFEMLCNAAGIECVYVTGKAGSSYEDAGGHAWNMVKLGDSWYNVDCTWDDPTGDTDEPDVSGWEGYAYFMISDATLSKNHFWTYSLKALNDLGWTGEPGWQSVGGRWVFYDDDGILVTGPRKIDGKLYGLGADGRLMGAGWNRVGGKWYFADGNGVLYTNAWIRDGADWYYMGSDGAVATGWVTDKGTRYYMDENGRMVFGWVKSGGNWYLTDGNGAMVTGWYNDGGVWYYFDKNGVMQTGWTEYKDHWYYLDDGAMTTGWLLYNGRWYMLDPNGMMFTGWYNDSGSWYYFDGDGAMATGWAEVAGRWEKFSDEGAWMYTWDGK